MAKRKPCELKLYWIKNPDDFDKAVAAYSEDEARKLVGGNVELIERCHAAEKTEAATRHGVSETSRAEEGLAGVGLSR